VDRARRLGAASLFAAAAAVYAFDRLTKLWAEARFVDRPVDVIPGVLTLRFTTNSGGAFGIGRSAPWVFVTATLVVSALILATSFRHRAGRTAVALGLVLGGALGNLTDRAVRGPGFSGRVVDFIDLQVWPVFNLADAAIVVGAALLAFSSVADGRAGDDGRDDGRDPGERGRAEGSDVAGPRRDVA
jgi:signal peptidase II